MANVKMDSSQSKLGVINELTSCEYATHDDLKSIDLSGERFNCLHLNVRSLHKNYDNLLILLDSFAQSGVDVHLVMLCETFLNNTSVSFAKLPGYVGYHALRENKTGGGISVFVRDTLTVNKVYDTVFSDTFESKFLNITYGKHSIDCGEVYRIPNTNPNIFKDELETLFSVLSGDNVVLGTDQNINFVHVDTFKPAMNLLDFFLSRQVVPCITKPTRVTFENATLIDNIYVRTKHFVETISLVILDDMSDHYPCFISMNLPVASRRECKYYTNRKFDENSDFNIKHSLLHYDWSPMQTMNVDDSYNYLVTAILDMLNLYAPVRTKKVSNINSFTEPWMTVKFLKYNRKCKKLCAQAKNSKSKDDINKYKEYRRSVNVLKRHDKKAFYCKLFEKISNNTKTVWSVLNSLCKKTRNRTEITELLYNGELWSNPKDVVNALNDHFASAGTKTQKNIEATDRDPLVSVTNCNTKLSKVHVTDIEIERIVNQLKPKMSSGIDGLSNDFLKKIFVSIRVPLTDVITKSLRDGIFPSAMKIAKINPLFKGGSNEICDNYRPISLLPVMSKIIEKIVYKRTVFHLNENNLIYCKQFGFRKNHGTSDAINLLLAEILEKWDKGFSVIGVFIDLRKAFDTVSHQLILSKLSKLGICGDLLSWFQSYLSGRTQFTQLGPVKSLSSDITVGVPQGSLLGVLLFQLIIDDLRRSIRYGSVILYADDTTILAFGNNIRLLQKKLQSDLNSLSVWLRSNNLALNVAKTKAILFRKHPHADDLNLTMNGQCIEFVDRFKFLGFTIDSKLTCEYHFSNVHGKLLRGIYLLSKLKDLISSDLLKQLYYAHFHSHLVYAISTWGSMLPKRDIDTLFKLQKRSVRLICKKSYRSHTDPLYKSLGILKIHDEIELSQVKIVYKVVNDMSPVSIKALYKMGKGANTRNSNLIIPKNLCSELNKSYLVRSISSWNKLPLNVKTAPSLMSFCKRLKNSYLTNY